VVWNLATGAPDEIASVLVGSNGSATTLFAQQLDGLFSAITDAVSSIKPAAAAMPGLASPTNILSLAALILLLGTVGVLVVCRLALAALLIIGPVFIVLALFEGTRGLFEGWLKSVAMFALVPLLTVVMGSGMLVAIAPMVAGLGADGGEISLRSAVSILVAAIIYLSLMLVVFKVASMLTRSWRLGRAAANQPGNAGGYAGGHQERPLTAAAAPATAAATAVASDRVRSTVASLETMASSHRLPAPAMARLAIPAPAPIPALAAPNDARGQLRYLHHRVAGASTKDSREMLR
jgi:type IV secretion system protein VirB6